MLLGVAPVLIVFHLCIGGDWGEFRTDYLRHLSIGLDTSKTRLQIFESYLYWMSFGFEFLKGAVLGGIVIAVAVAAVKTLPRLRVILIAMLAGAGLNLVTAIPAAYRVSFLYAAMSVAFAVAVSRWKDRVNRRDSLAMAFGLCFMLPMIPSLIALCSREPDNRAEVKRQLKGCEGRPIYCNPPVAWLVFDWDLPPALQSLQLTSSFAHIPLPADAVVIRSQTEFENHPLKVFGRTFRSTSLNAQRWRLESGESYENEVRKVDWTK